MTDLPADSRITSRTDGSTLIITVPLRRRRRWASWGGVASFAFLAVVCLAQGMLRRQAGWIAAGLAFLLISAWQWGMLARWGTAVFEISPELLTIQQSGAASGRMQWSRADVAVVRAERGALRIGGAGASEALLEGHDLYELHWLAEQIRGQWEMD